ncbi:MAG: DUF4411 family protein [Crocosphaera sp.]|nr:DUF4411 family protein [Crocosphaera sp.]
MIYIFDTNSFRVLSHYFPEIFPTVWEKIDLLVNNGNLISVREVYNELNRGSESFIIDWAKENKKVFVTPTPDEMMFVSQIFAVPHFQTLVTKKQRLKGTPIADPFIIAAAKVKEGCVVTEEVFKPNAAKIPNVCQYFNIDCTNVQGFMKRESWRF